MRNARDKTLDMPVLILPSVQINMRAGHFPPPRGERRELFEDPSEPVVTIANRQNNDHDKRNVGTIDRLSELPRAWRC
jgi:hypothetical protein